VGTAGTALPEDDDGNNELDRQLASGMLAFLASKYAKVGVLVSQQPRVLAGTAA
jgi:hypothetical protein